MKRALWLIAGLFVGTASVIAWNALVAQDDGESPMATVPRIAPPAAPAIPPPAPAEPMTLLDIATLASAFERNKAMYELVARADRAQVEGLLVQALDLPASLQRHDMVRILYIRFAAIEPEAAADHVLGVRHRPAWLAAVFRAWAHADLNAAMQRAASLDAAQRDVIADALLETDQPAWLRERIAKDLGAESELGEMLAREELALGTPEQAWATALAMPGGGERQSRLRTAALAWTNEDPITALRAVAQVPGDNGQMLEFLVMNRWAKRDPVAAANWLSQQEMSDHTRYLASGLLFAVADDGIQAAFDVLDQLPAWIHEHGRGSILSRWVESDLESAREWFDALPLAEQQSLSFTIARPYAARYPQEAFNWAMAADSKIREGLLDDVIAGIEDSAVAERLFRSIADPELQTDIAFWLYLQHAPADPREALSWTETFRPDMQEQLRDYVYRDWAESDPEEAIRQVLRQADPAARGNAAANVIEGLLEAFNAADAERLFEVIDAAAPRRSAAYDLRRYFTEVEPDPRKAAAYDKIYQSLIGRED